MKTHRDDVNPYEDLDQSVGRDSSVDSEVPVVHRFVPVLCLVLSQSIQAESPLQRRLCIIVE